MNKLTQLLAVPFVASGIIISGCKHSDSSAETNPDFNREIVFKDYGTYGRTVYFEDTDGKTWCYYDLLTIDNPEQLKLTVSAPMEEQCSTGTDLILITYNSLITSEVAGDGITSIQTMTRDFDREAMIYPSNGVTREPPPFLPSDSTLRFMTILNAAIFGGNPAVVSLNLKSENDELYGNIPYILDYLTSDKEFQNEDFMRANSATLFISYYALFSLDDLPDPSVDVPFPAAAQPVRSEIYADHPYQKLSTTEADPYPLNQIRVE
ncbi:MAG: hypothetical protein CSH36_12535 [Thalassolituus sp.]|nr:MAG: hypothetical protein CSH36_12535 [Thalassolituus sp.]